MENTVITSHTELLCRIAALKEEKLIQEDELNNDFREFVSSLKPLSVLKESLSELAQDKEAHISLAKAGLNLGTNFIIEKVLGRSNSIKGFLSSILLEKIATPFINNNVSKIASGISKLVHKKPEIETSD